MRGRGLVPAWDAQSQHGLTENNDDIGVMHASMWFIGEERLCIFLDL